MRLGLLVSHGSLDLPQNLRIIVQTSFCVNLYYFKLNFDTIPGRYLVSLLFDTFSHCINVILIVAYHTLVTPLVPNQALHDSFVHYISHFHTLHTCTHLQSWICSSSWHQFALNGIIIKLGYK